MNGWNAQVSPGGTATNMSHNGNLGPGQSAQFGFQVARPSGSAVPTNFSCSAS